MNRSIELRDSTIAGVSGDDDKVVVSLESASIHESEGTPGVDDGRVFSQNLEIRISEPSLRPVIKVLPARILDGALKIAGRSYGNLVPLPVIHSGEVEVWFETDAAERFSVRGRAVVVVLMGERQSLDEPERGRES